MMPEEQEVLTTIARESRIYQRNRKEIVESAIADYNMSISNKEKNPEANLIEQEEPATKSVAIQTEVEANCTRTNKIREQEKVIKSLKEMNSDINKKCERKYKIIQNMENSLRKMYTEGQINKLKYPEKKINCSLDDMSSAICLHSVSACAYRCLYRKNHPLPGVSTLRKWANKKELKPGMVGQEN